MTILQSLERTWKDIRMPRDNRGFKSSKSKYCVNFLEILRLVVQYIMDESSPSEILLAAVGMGEVPNPVTSDYPADSSLYREHFMGTASNSGLINGSDFLTKSLHGGL